MRKTTIPILLLFFLVSCRNEIVEKPLWLNNNYNIFFPKDSLIFKTDKKNWEVKLLSFTQPIPLRILYNKQGFSLIAKNSFGIIEGPALLIISNGSQEFYYQLNLLNNSRGVIASNDYRFPKTLNSDSSLTQQIMLHNIDEWRNISTLPNQLNYFQENIIEIKPISGTYQAQEKKPLSSFYVQSGSAKLINITSNYIKPENAFSVTVGPLKDKYDNTVANGTLVVFIFKDDEFTYRIETQLKNGYASVKIPAKKNKQYQIFAKVNETTSQKIQLQF